MRVASVTLLLAAAPLACGGRSVTRRPARIEVACAATKTGASCVFRNEGPAPGDRCVTVLAGRRGAPTVARSRPVCARTLRPGVEATREVTVTPALACDQPSACLVRVADRGREDDVMAVLGDELAAPPTGPATAAECDQVAAHIFDLTFAEATALKTSEDRDRLARELTSQRDAQIAGYRDACLSRVTRAQLACALAAVDTTELRRCDEVP